MQTTYTVEGMTCGHCVAAVTEEVKQIPGVTDVAVTLEDGRLVVTSTDPVDFDRVVEAVAVTVEDDGGGRAARIGRPGGHAQEAEAREQRERRGTRRAA